MKSTKFLLALACLMSIFCLTIPQVVHSQSVPNSRPSYEWQKIRTPKVRVIYKKENYEAANSVANRLQHSSHSICNSLAARTSSVDVVLREQSSISNGFVSFGPRYSEFFGASPQDYKFLANNNWMDLLTIHEYRHVAQLDKSRTDDNEIAYQVGGELAAGFLASASMPQWFWEGDAVCIETALTKSGRGRSPHFDILMRANSQDRKSFGYHKSLLRSYRYPMPDWYTMGYHFTAWLRQQYGDEVIMNFTEYTFGRPWLPWRHSFGHKKYTGHFMTTNFKKMMDDFDNETAEQIDELKLSSFDILNNRNYAAYHSLLYPQPQIDGSILAVKSGIGDISQLIRLSSDGTTKRVFSFGLWNDPGFLSAVSNKVVWNEYGYHPRWGRESYSNIRLLDLETGKLTKTHRARYHGSAISPDGTKIVTIEYSENQKYRIVILDAFSLQEIQSLSTEEEFFYSMFRFTDVENEVVGMRHKDGGKEIITVDMENGEQKVWHRLGDINPYENFGHPIKHGNFIFYSSGLTTIDNLYAIDCKVGTKYQITESKFGAYNPSISPDGQWLIYNDFTVNGYDIVGVSINSRDWREVEPVDQDLFQEASYLAEAEANADILSNAPKTQLPSKEYHRHETMLKPYMWGPLGLDSDGALKLGLRTRDRLNNIDLSGGIGFESFNLDSGAFIFLDGSYLAQWPIVNFGFQLGSIYPNYEEDGLIQEPHPFGFLETNYYVGFELPLELTNSKFRRGVSIQSSYNFSHLKLVDHEGYVLNSAVSRSSYEPFVSLSFAASNIHKASTRDVISPWGQSIAFSFRETLEKSDTFSSATRFNLNLQFRSPLEVLFKNHRIHHACYVRLGMYDVQGLKFNEQVRMVNGGDIQGRLNVISTGYVMPLWLPDIHLLSIANIKRLSIDAFYDFEPDGRQRLFGTSLLVDTDLFRKLVLSDIRFVFRLAGDELEDLSFSFGMGINSLFSNPVRKQRVSPGSLSRDYIMF